MLYDVYKAVSRLLFLFGIGKFLGLLRCSRLLGKSWFMLSLQASLYGSLKI